MCWYLQPPARGGIDFALNMPMKRYARTPLASREPRGRRRRVLVPPNVELSGHQRYDARPWLAKMYNVPPTRAWWHAVGAPP
jgi:hypothetical protein